MLTHILKRALPFTLTLSVGVLAGSLSNLFNFNRGSSEPPAFTSTRTYRTGCRKSYRPRSYDSSPQPVIRFKPQPSYTEAARRNRVTGVVKLDVVFGADGRVSGVEVIESLPDGLTERAIRAAEEIQFDPATINGVPVPTKKQVHFQFNIY